MSAQILIDDDSFELLAEGHALGPRRRLDAEALALLDDFARRDRMLLRERSPNAGLLALGRDLFAWLDGQGGALTTALSRAVGPWLLEIRGPLRPSAGEWSLLRAPWELLADADGHLARNPLLAFAPVRRLGAPREAAAPDDYRLGLAFMAAAPWGERTLDQEAEECAILDAVGGGRELDLIVEESGDPDQLGQRLAELEGLPVVHLSCHGTSDWTPPGAPKAQPRPVLLMEDEAGEPNPTDAAALIQALRPAPPRLLFVSACLSATPSASAAAPAGPGHKEGAADVRGSLPPVRGSAFVHSLATALVEGGAPAVLGWDGKVADTAATAFAKHFYQGLARRLEPAQAVAKARLALFESDDPNLAHDWHLARLWLGPEGGPPVVAGGRKRSLLPATHGQKEMLGKQVRVASHEMFVGRRRQLQRALSALRGDRAGVLLHGMGRLGKSSLAARIANRLRHALTLVVVYDRYGAADLIDRLLEALQSRRPARDLLREGRERLRQDPDRAEVILEDLLIELLSGPCAQSGDGTPPLLLLIDDLEQILETDSGVPPFRVQARSAPVLRAVLRAFDCDRSDSRLLITSRFPFVLEGLEERLLPIQLPPFSPADRRKLQRRQGDAAHQGQPAPDLEAREALLTQVAAIARGNPGLQDLLGPGLVLSPSVALERARELLARMDAWLAGAASPEPEVQGFLQNLAVETLLDLAGQAGRDLLRALALPVAPIPEARARELALSIGGDLDSLAALGLIDPFEDLFDHRIPALAVNALAEPRLAPVTDDERGAIAGLLLPGLFEDWGGAPEADRRPLACDLSLTRLALAADDPGVVALCAADAVQALADGPAVFAAELARDAVALLDRHGRVIPWRLLSRGASAVATAGEGAEADALFARGAAALETARAAGDTPDPLDAGHLLFEQAKRLVTRGEPNAARRLFEEAAELADLAGSEISVAVARGEIADILAGRGELDEALRIRREEQLPVYERLGEVRARESCAWPLRMRSGCGCRRRNRSGRSWSSSGWSVLDAAWVHV
jgi:CHAT domain/AAA ATPase domain